MYTLLTKLTLLFKRITKLIKNNRSVRVLFIETLVTTLVCTLTSNIVLITFGLLSYLIFKMLWDYRKNRSFSHLKMGSYLLAMLFLLSTIVFHDIKFLQAKIIIASYVFAATILLSPYYMELPPHYLIYAGLLGEHSKKTYNQINVVSGLFTLCIFAMNIWIASSFSPPVWLWFKTAITPMMVIAYSVIQFYIWNKHEQIK